jgi:phosphoglucosamine mutase
MERPELSLFGTSGIRGVVNVDLSPILALRIGMALARVFKSGVLTLGRDTRTSGAMLSASLTGGALAGGLEVKDLGVIPTPVLAYLTKSVSAVSGVMVTASHNPPEFNGLKLFNRHGIAYDEDLQNQIEHAFTREAHSYANWNQLKDVSSVDLSSKYVEMILRQVRLDRNWNLAVDIGSGAAHQVAFDLFRSLRCHVVSLNAQPDGFFPGRSPEPTAQSLTTLMVTVRTMKCDIGIAFDGDADRVSFVDESGRYIEGDVALGAFASWETQKKGGGNVALPVDASLAVQEAVEKSGGRVIWTKVGDTSVADAITRKKAIFGGEPCGAWIHPDFHICPDGILSAILVLKAIEERNVTTDEFFSGIATYPMKRTKISCENSIKAKVMRMVASDLPKALDEKSEVTELDGVRIQVPSGWLLIRPSGTEPAIRLTVEARSEQMAEYLFSTGHNLCMDRIRKCQS